MLLALNVGNTHIGIGCFDHDQLSLKLQVSTQEILRLENQLANQQATHLSNGDSMRDSIGSYTGSSIDWIRSILAKQGVSWSQVEAIAISSVVPQVTDGLLRTASVESNRLDQLDRADQSELSDTSDELGKLNKLDQLDKPLFVLNRRSPFSFEISSDIPQGQPGNDRLMNAEAAIRDYGAPCIIVDAGTATTICAVKKGTDGTRGKALFLGGAIIPGMALGMNALVQNTAQLFPVDLVPPQNAIGKNTHEALQSGIVLGYASLIDGMVRRFKSELGWTDSEETDSVETDSVGTVIATGGISPLLKGVARELTHFDPDLTLRGIYYVFESIRHR